MSFVIGGSMGGGGGGGHTPVLTPDNVRSDAIVTVIEALSEGEIEGFSLLNGNTPTDVGQCLYLNETPLHNGTSKNFETGAVALNRGLQTQDYLADLQNGSASNQISVSTYVTKAAPVIRTINTANVNAVRVVVRFDGLQRSNSASGDVTGTSVIIAIDAKVGSGNWIPVDLGGYVVKGAFEGTVWVPEHTVPNLARISHKTSSPYEHDFLFNLADISSHGPYDIRVSRVTNDHNSTYVDKFQWSSYTEIIYGKFYYPNTAHVKTLFSAKDFSQIPARGYCIKGLRIKTPNNYNGTTRTYSGGWGGGFTTQWTRNPAWILYDLITDPRYGLGQRINESQLDKWQFYSIAQYCDELVPDGKGGTQPRYSLDLYLQEQAPAKKVLQDIASTFATMIFWHGGGVYLSQDRPKPVTALFTAANVINGKFAYAGTARQQRYTACYVSWNDPDNFFRKTIEYVESESYIQRYGFLETPIDAVGCTNRAQAHQYGKYFLYSGLMETEVVVFSVGLDGLNSMPGDIIHVNDPIKSIDATKRSGGRLAAGSTINLINLDASTHVIAGSSLHLISPTGDVLTRACTNSTGDYTTLSISPDLPTAPDPLAVWILEQPGQSTARKFRILDVKENAKNDTNGHYEITAVEYNEAKFNLIFNTFTYEPITKDPLKNLLYVAPPENVQVTSGLRLTQESKVRYIDISWTAPANSNAVSYIISWAVNDGEVHRITTGLFSARIENAQPGEYIISVTAVGALSGTSTAVEVGYTLNELFNIDAVHVTGLALKYGGTQFTGRNAEFVWSTDADTVLGLSTTYGQAAGGQSLWFRDYEIKVYHGVTLLRTDYVTETAYSYTFEKNTEDGGPFRDVIITVKARDQFGRYSQSQSLSVSNPPPASFGSVTLTPGMGQVFVDYLPPDDPDYIYTVIYASKTAGFTPSPATLVAESSTRSAIFKTDLNGTYYVRLQGVDEFGVSGTIYSSAFSVDVVSDITLAVQEILADPGRPGDTIVETSRFLLVAPGQTAPVTAVFGVALVDGISKVAIHGDLLADGSIYGRSIAAHTISAEKISVDKLSAFTAQLGNAVISSTGSLKSTDKDYGDSEAGFYLGYDGDFKFEVYNSPTSYFRSYPNPEMVGAVIKNNAGQVVLNAGDTANSLVNGQIGGRGVNICNPRYTSFEEGALPPLSVTNGGVALIGANKFFGLYSLELHATAADCYAYLGASPTDYNIKLQPNKKWIISAYCLSASTANIELSLRTSAAGTHNFISSTLIAPSIWNRVYGVVDLTADGSTGAIMRIDNNVNGHFVYFDGLMIEEQVGAITTPSAYNEPPNFRNDYTGDLAATANIYTHGSGLPSGGSNGDVYLQDLPVGIIWHNVAGSWEPSGKINGSNVGVLIPSAVIGSAQIVDANIKTLHLANDNVIARRDVIVNTPVLLINSDELYITSPSVILPALASGLLSDRGDVEIVFSGTIECTSGTDWSFGVSLHYSLNGGGIWNGYVGSDSGYFSKSSASLAAGGLGYQVIARVVIPKSVLGITGQLYFRAQCGQASATGNRSFYNYTLTASEIKR